MQLTEEQKLALGRIEYFLEAFDFRGIGQTIQFVPDSPNTIATLTIKDLKTVLSALK